MNNINIITVLYNCAGRLPAVLLLLLFSCVLFFFFVYCWLASVVVSVFFFILFRIFTSKESDFSQWPEIVPLICLHQNTIDGSLLKSADHFFSHFFFLRMQIAVITLALTIFKYWFHCFVVRQRFYFYFYEMRKISVDDLCSDLFQDWWMLKFFCATCIACVLR